MIIITAMIVVIADASKVTFIITTCTSFMAITSKYFAVWISFPPLLTYFCTLEHWIRIDRSLAADWFNWILINGLAEPIEHSSLHVTFTSKLGQSSCALHRNTEYWPVAKKESVKHPLQMVLISQKKINWAAVSERIVIASSTSCQTWSSLTTSSI